MLFFTEVFSAKTNQTCLGNKELREWGEKVPPWLGKKVWLYRQLFGCVSPRPDDDDGDGMLDGRLRLRVTRYVCYYLHNDRDSEQTNSFSSRKNRQILDWNETWFYRSRRTDMKICVYLKGKEMGGTEYRWIDKQMGPSIDDSTERWDRVSMLRFIFDDLDFPWWKERQFLQKITWSKKNHDEVVFKIKKKVDTSPFCGATGYPVLNFWWRLFWVSKPEWVALFALGGGVLWGSLCQVRWPPMNREWILTVSTASDTWLGLRTDGRKDRLVGRYRQTDTWTHGRSDPSLTVVRGDG